MDRQDIGDGLLLQETVVDDQCFLQAPKVSGILSYLPYAVRVGKGSWGVHSSVHIPTNLTGVLNDHHLHKGSKEAVDIFHPICQVISFLESHSATMSTSVAGFFLFIHSMSFEF